VLETESNGLRDKRLSESHARLRNPYFIQQVKNTMILNALKEIEAKSTKSTIDEKLLNIYNELL